MKLLVSPDSVWYEIPILEDSKCKEYYNKMTETQKTSCRTKAASLYEDQVKKYRSSKEMTNADKKWLETVLKEGTQSDRISAMLLQVKECPLYGLEWITNLLMMASSTSRHESYAALEALKEIFLLVLPPKLTGRKMFTWRERCITDNKDLTATSVLIIAYFEDLLITSYVEYLKLLEIILHDQVEIGREKSLRIIFELLLSYKSMHSETLLNLLVNKLGDPKRKIASRVVYYVQCAVEKYEELTLPVVKLVQVEATRPSTNDKSAFYGLTFFSQLKLNEGSPEVTDILLETYQFFLANFIKQLEEQAKVKKQMSRNKRRKLSKEDENNGEDEIPRVAKVALLGLTRAIPFINQNSSGTGLMSYASSLLSIAGRIKSFPTLLQASSLIYKIFTQDDRGYEVSLGMLSELVCKYLLDYGRMSQATASHPHLFKLLYQMVSILGSSPHPNSLNCLRSICKSLLSVSLLVANPSFSASSLLLINEALSLRSGLRLAITFPDDDEKSSDSLFWELDMLRRHCHPTVAEYASIILTSDRVLDRDPQSCWLSLI